MATEQYSTRLATITTRWESIKNHVNQTLWNPTIISVDWIESIVYGGYVLASESFKDYVNGINIPLRRAIIAMSIIFIDLLYILDVSYILYRNELDIYCLAGLPLHGISSARLFLLPFGILMAFGCFSRTLGLVKERKRKIEAINIFNSLVNPLNKGKLNDRNYLKLARIIATQGFILPKIFAAIYIAIFLFLIIQTFHAYFNPAITFSYSLLIGLFAYPFCAWLNSLVFMAGYISYISTTLFLTLRFKQVAERIKKCKRQSELIAAIVEHNQLCGMNHRNNHFMKWILFEVYYVGSVLIDLSLLIAIYFNNLLVVRLLYCLIAFVVVTLFFLIAFVSALLSAAAHSPYKSLNSRIAKSWLSKKWRKIPLENMWKLNNLIERLAQTHITVWCLDLFPLNYYELYLFIAAIASNFFLFLDLAKQ